MSGGSRRKHLGNLLLVLLVKMEIKLTGSQMDWKKMLPLGMKARRCSCPRGLLAAAAPTAPDKNKQIVEALISGIQIVFSFLKGFVFILHMLIKYLIPVGWIWLFLYLLLNPLQICCNESLKTHTVIRLRREGPTVAHESVHPVLVDELKQTYSKTLC